MENPARRIATLLFALALPSLGVCHDLWLIPEVRKAGKGLVRIHSGTKFPESEHAPDPTTFLERRLVSPDGGPGPLRPEKSEGEAGIMSFDIIEPGVYLAAVQTRPKMLSLTAEKFNSYLISDGLSQVYLDRQREGSLGKASTERYSKSPKVIVRCGAGPGDPCRPLGLTLEIIPLHDPLVLSVGQTLPVRVLFRTVPLVGGNLGWDWPHEGESPVGTVRTDVKGEALIPIARPGLMTVRLTHMTRPNKPEYEWESFWTTLTFRTQGGDGR